MAVRNILDQLSGGGSAPDVQYFYSTDINWSGAFNVTGTITFAKTNNLCVIVCSPVSSPSITSASEIIGSVVIPPEMLPQDGTHRSSLNIIRNNNQVVVGNVYFGSDYKIHISASTTIGTPFPPGLSIAGAPNGAIMVYLI